MIPFRKTAALAFALLTAGMLFGCGAPSEPESSAAESQQSSEAPAESSEPADAPESDAASQPDEETNAVIGFETVTAKPGDKKVPLTVVIRNNPGFSGAGLQIAYDPALSPQLGETDPDYEIPDAIYEAGPVLESFLTTCMVGEENHLIAFGCMGSQPATKDGVLFTCYFDVPEDAAPGTEYHFQGNLDSMNSGTGTDQVCRIEEGILKIE